MAVATNDVADLWKASIALGLAYGGMYGLFPTIAIEWFGIGGWYFNVYAINMLKSLTIYSQRTFLRTGDFFPFHP